MTLTPQRHRLLQIGLLILQIVLIAHLVIYTLQDMPGAGNYLRATVWLSLVVSIGFTLLLIWLTPKRVETLRGWLMDDNYLQAQIEYDIEDVTDGQRRVVFDIQPGSRARRIVLAFEGASAIHPDELNRLIEAQIQQRMLANVTHEYALRTVDRAIKPDVYDKVRPKKALMTVVGGFLGAFFMAVFVLLRGTWSGLSRRN